jgi:hypothetical protein
MREIGPDGGRVMSEAHEERANAQDQEWPGAAGQAAPRQEQKYARNNDNDSDSHNVNDSVESSPSCGWRGVCITMDVKPGR